MNQIDILLGTYNGELFISEQIDSILNQSYTDYRLIIRDDSSTDKTKKILLDYQLRFPHKIMIIDNNENLGVIANFSKLLEISSAPYIMFCDQDDVWLPEKVKLTFEKMLEIEKLSSDTPLLIHTDLKVVNLNLNILSDSYWSYQGIDPKYDTLNRLLVQNVITGCTVMINKKLADLALPIPNKTIMHDWWLGLVASSFGQIYYIDMPTILYRQHTNNNTGATSFNLRTTLKQIQNLSDIDLRKYTVQAEQLLLRYEESFGDKSKRLLYDFISIQKQSWLKSKYILLKYEIIKQGLLRNMGLFFCK